ncbi:unnamed protein product [Pleuronectes platessa]|uniref:Uncharacterized protein n=1 Tax=Pleuronectes platessa TaxID=8262 RepID=A0A9N7Z930_PLEPL|nr:unnamed protein product [Pleuronectes platessa]
MKIKVERWWTSGRNLDYGQKRSLVRLWFDSMEKKQKDEPGLICPKIQGGFSLPCLVPLSKAPYSPNICSPGAVYGCSLLCVSCTRWVKSRG